MSFIYKIVTKVIVNRIRPILNRIVSPTQSSFLPGRSTMDNIIIVQELIHTSNKKKGRKGGMIIKLDLAKAYDRIRWGFIQQILVEGFRTSLLS